MLTSQPLKDAQHVQPFKPFTIHMADGKSVGVTHPECMLLTHKGRTVVVNTPDHRMEVIDVLLIARLSFNNEPQAKRRRSG